VGGTLVIHKRAAGTILGLVVGLQSASLIATDTILVSVLTYRCLPCWLGQGDLDLYRSEQEAAAIKSALSI